MARAIVVSNGEMCVTLDLSGRVRDVYYPYVGLENQVSGEPHKIGIRINGVFSWIESDAWEISIGYKPATMVSKLLAKNKQLGVSVVMEDAVYNESNVWLRQVEVYNNTNSPLEIQLFFHQVYMISESRKRNTAFYDPTHNTVVHYKGRRVFVVNACTSQGSGIDEYSVGAFQSEGKEGTYKDAEDGTLGKNAVEHGNVDSVIRLSLGSCEGKQKVMASYWVCAAESIDAAYLLNSVVLEKTVEGMLHSTEEFWRAWLNKQHFHLTNLSQEQQRLFETSLFILRAHADNRGSVIASADSEMIEYGKDDYSYMWPRDAAFIVSTLDSAGYQEITKHFFEFCAEVLHPDGYLHHRYRPDRSLGSTWHSSVAQREWLKDRILQLPIQEDETASVLIALWKHYEKTKDIEFIENLFRPFIEKMAEFLVNFREKETGLPLYSYDLWEEKIGVSTYTCACVYAGLVAAAKFGELLGKRNHMRRYKQAAKEIKAATEKYLFSTERNSFIRVAYYKDGQIVQDQTIDSSTWFGLWYFGMYTYEDKLLTATRQRVEETLRSKQPTGGFIRYEHDNYFRSTEASNPWIITTLWHAQERLSKAEITDDDLDSVRATLDWVIKHRYPSGVLAEQLDPITGASLSATPLVWSHAVYVEVVLKYIQAMEARGLCVECDKPEVHEL